MSKNESRAVVREVERARGPNRLRDIALIKVLLHTGVRIEEAASLSWKSFELSERKGEMTVVGKGAKTRSVDLNVEARKALMDLAHGAEDWRQRPGRSSLLGSDNPIFEGREGRLTANALWRIVARYGRLAQVGDLSPHVFRHTFGHDLSLKGVPIQVISEMLGHKSVATTMIYVKAGREEMRAAVELLVDGDDEAEVPPKPRSRKR